ncbi:hypothetical protein SAMN04487891_1179 [Flagellimonas taeanensis]|uniref:Calx-beta domain-containing protein n=1 Tax=Flagellimonas taeanensis TaxID=1005926 RepID=A0A1M7CSC9_9FLAO|nr:hypothetical protein [Allomuricauda taeanensis]SFC64758.1 hypothetical protein SAMN04487891_1179 [Allomuricauda taeanensis]SHL70080.1 hypothetical protein SAMN05216293_4106 [Allomuricauda taeanensis]
MKKSIFKGIGVFLLSGVLFMSCEENETPVIDFGVGFLQLSATTGTISEDSSEPLVTTVLLGNDGTNPNGVTVNFTVTSSDESRFTVSPSSGTIDIPAGEFSADILIQPLDNFDVDGDIDIVIELSESSDLPIGIAGEGVVAYRRVVELVDNDCPVDSDAFVGTFTVEEVFTGGGNEGLSLAAEFGEEYLIELTPQPGDLSGTKFIVTNATEFTFIADGTVLTLLTCSQSVSFGAEAINIALFANLTIESAVYDEEASTITVSGPLGPYGPYEFKLTRQ